nr:transcription antitermination factor NusB [Nocardioides panacisoli]
MGARSKARKRALDLLYAADLRGETGEEALARVTDDDAAPHNPYTAELVRGVSEHLERIDDVLRQFAQGWSLARMATVDRNVLRLGVFELLYVEDVPDHVAITEAMALVKDLSTDESPQFVNGVLGAIEREKPALTS